MKLMVCGSRTINNYYYVADAIQYVCRRIGQYPSLIISGAAYGSDVQALIWAIRHGVPRSVHVAEWNKYGKSAGYRRNVDMVDECDLCIAIWDGVSKGTAHSIQIARSKGKPVWVFQMTVPKYRDYIR